MRMPDGIMALSMDVCVKVMEAMSVEMSRRQAAARFDIGPATSVRWARCVADTGDVAVLKTGGDRRPQRIEAHGDFIRAELEERPDLTILDLREKMRERCGVAFDHATVWRFLRCHAITRKKKTGHASGQERQDVAAAREAWFEGQPDLDPKKLVFIDETAVSTTMVRRFGRAARAAGCPFSSDGKTKTLVAALRFNSVDAPMTTEGALDGASFLAYVEQILTPTLSAGKRC